MILHHALKPFKRARDDGDPYAAQQFWVARQCCALAKRQAKVPEFVIESSLIGHTNEPGHAARSIGAIGCISRAAHEQIAGEYWNFDNCLLTSMQPLFPHDGKEVRNSHPLKIPAQRLFLTRFHVQYDPWQLVVVCEERLASDGFT